MISSGKFILHTQPTHELSCTRVSTLTQEKSFGKSTFYA